MRVLFDDEFTQKQLQKVNKELENKENMEWTGNVCNTCKQRDTADFMKEEN